MCLITKEPEMVATKPILVYKVIRDDNRSFYCHFPYTPNQKYQTKLAVESFLYQHESMTKVEDGFHAWMDKQEAIRESDTLNSEFWQDTKIVSFTIPKGALYYLGNRKDIVSNKINSGDLSPC